MNTQDVVSAKLHFDTLQELTAGLKKLRADNAALRAEVRELTQRIMDDNKAYGCELRDPSGTIRDYAREWKEDSDRLEWLFQSESNARAVCLFPSWGWGNRIRPEKPSIKEAFRAAIDAAREGGAK